MLKKNRPNILFYLISIFSVNLLLNFGLHAQENPIEIHLDKNLYEIEAGQNFPLKIELTLPKGYRAYSEKFKLSLQSSEIFSVHQISIHPEQEFFDSFSKKNKKGMIEKATLQVVIEAPAQIPAGDYVQAAELSYQACTDRFCLFPTQKNFEFTIAIKKNSHTSQQAVPEKDSESFLDFSSAMKKGLHWAFIISFIAGFLTSLTPCVFPIIPITIAVLGKNAHLHSKKKNFFLAHLYVLGIALTYSVLGVFAAASGSLFGAFIHHPAILSMMCLVFLTMAFSMFGFFQIQAPLFIRQKLSGNLHLHGYGSAFLYGIVAGLVAGPCVGPILVSILTYVAQTQNLWLGFWLLFVFAIGMGQLFLLIGYSSQITKKLPQSGEWMEVISQLFGYCMLGVFYFYLRFLLPSLTWKLSIGIGLILVSIIVLYRKTKDGMNSKMNKILHSLVILAGVFVLIFSQFNLQSEQVNSSWLTYSDEKLETALQHKTPVIIDFWAEWCAACHELEEKTFSQPLFKELSKDFVLLKFDATQESEKLKVLKEKYKIVGLPTLVFYDNTGEYREDLKVTEFMTIDVFAERMRKAKQPTIEMPK